MLKKKKSGIFIYIVFCLYLIVLVYILLLKADLKFVSQGYAGVYQGTFQRPANYNIKPFVTIKAYLLSYRNTGDFNSLLNLLGNVLAFVPFGFLVPLLSSHKKTFLLTFLSGSCLIFIIELVQLITVWGIFDVDDYLLNIIGVLLGWILSRLLLKNI